MATRSFPLAAGLARGVVKTSSGSALGGSSPVKTWASSKAAQRTPQLVRCSPSPSSPGGSAPRECARSAPLGAGGLARCALVDARLFVALLAPADCSSASVAAGARRRLPEPPFLWFSHTPWSEPLAGPCGTAAGCSCPSGFAGACGGTGGGGTGEGLSPTAFNCSL